MNQMNVAGMNPGVGPVGGIPMMNSGSSAPRSEPNANIQDSMVIRLNTYIYDYFLKRGYYDCARALIQDDSVHINTSPASKSAPGHRRDGDMNGVDGDGLLGDSKEDTKSRIPDDLPRPNLNGDTQQTSFLFDWFNLFWDIFWAQRKRGKSDDVMQYIQHNQNMLRLRDQQHNQILRQTQMLPAQFNMRGVRSAMMPGNLQKTVLQNNTQNMSPQQLAQLQKGQQAQLLQHQMQREHSDMEMNGHRPPSPSSAENAPSPSKRPRLDGSQVNGQPMAPNGRGQGQGIPGQPNPTSQLLMQHGINPSRLSSAQFQSFQAQNTAVQQKSLQVYNQNMAAMHHSRSAMNNQGMPNGLINPVMTNQSDIMPSMHEGQGLIPMQDFYGGNAQMPQVRPGGMQTPGGQTGNHALQDYQMQLILLEQQNKRRLLMARQEQEMTGRGDGQPGMPGQPNLPPGTSPQGSRAGTSPNPSEQMKRGTPKMPQTGLPGSPNVGDAMAQGRGSPASMNFGGSQMPPDMGGPTFFVKNVAEGVVGPNGMRPPSSNPAFSGPQVAQPMDAMSRPQQAPGAANRMPGGNWQQGPQGQPMVSQQQSTGQPQPAVTPQDRNTMPPPQAPSSGGAGTGRQPPSPQPGAAPPTPQQSNKAGPRGKKDVKDNTKKRPAKSKAPAANAANTAATPSSEAEPPPTPTPSTPITPVHPNSFNKGGANATSNAPQPTSAPAPQTLVPQQDPNQPFGDLTLQEPFSALDFTALDNPDILESFDFDTFLNTDDTPGLTFDPNFTYSTDGVEAGAGDGM